LFAAGDPNAYVCPSLEGKSVTWIAPDARLSWSDLGVSVPDVVVFSGWSTAAYLRLVREARQHGAVSICLIDNRAKHSWRQFVGALWFRFVFSRLVDGVMVPGASGRDLMRTFGLKPELVATGLYGADPTVFRPGPQWDCRSIDLLFVGQFIARKGLQELVRALQLLPANLHLRLVAVGQGPLGKTLASAGFEVHGHASPRDVAKLMADAKFLILPSLEENWGVVVHEAALCGCGLILTTSVGSVPDLLIGGTNGFLCDPRASSITSAIQAALGTDTAWRSNAMEVSVKLAEKFGPSCFASSLSQLIQKVLTSRNAKTVNHRLG
jgi:glycosyltransferase involved in cell wall biosynthesis